MSTTAPTSAPNAGINTTLQDYNARLANQPAPDANAPRIPGTDQNDKIEIGRGYNNDYFTITVNGKPIPDSHGNPQQFHKKEIEGLVFSLGGGQDQVTFKDEESAKLNLRFETTDGNTGDTVQGASAAPTPAANGQSTEAKAGTTVGGAKDTKLPETKPPLPPNTDGGNVEVRDLPNGQKEVLYGRGGDNQMTRKYVVNADGSLDQAEYYHPGTGKHTSTDHYNGTGNIQTIDFYDASGTRVNTTHHLQPGATTDQTSQGQDNINAITTRIDTHNPDGSTSVTFCKDGKPVGEPTVYDANGKHVSGPTPQEQQAKVAAAPAPASSPAAPAPGTPAPAPASTPAAPAPGTPAPAPASTPAAPAPGTPAPAPASTPAAPAPGTPAPAPASTPAAPAPGTPAPAPTAGNTPATPVPAPGAQAPTTDPAANGANGTQQLPPGIPTGGTWKGNVYTVEYPNGRKAEFVFENGVPKEARFYNEDKLLTSVDHLTMTPEGQINIKSVDFYVNTQQEDGSMKESITASFEMKPGVTWEQTGEKDGVYNNSVRTTTFKDGDPNKKTSEEVVLPEGGKVRLEYNPDTGAVTRREKFNAEGKLTMRVNYDANGKIISREWLATAADSERWPGAIQVGNTWIVEHFDAPSKIAPDGHVFNIHQGVTGPEGVNDNTVKSGYIPNGRGGSGPYKHFTNNKWPNGSEPNYHKDVPGSVEPPEDPILPPKSQS